MSSPDLNLAIAAAESGAWSAVINYLQHISLDESIDRFCEGDATRTQVLALALQVLTQGDFEEQWAIAKIIPKLGEIAIQPLLDIINDSEVDLEDRWFVARILGSFDRPDVVATLIELVCQDEDPELQAIAADALAKIGTSAIAMLTNLLDTSDCAIAVTVLAQIRHSQTIEPLLYTIDNADPQIRTLAIEALGSFHDPRIPPILLTKLTDLVPSVRQAAVVALCLRSDLATELNLVQQLRPLLFDLNLAVCRSTALGLARLKDPHAVIVLTEVLDSPQTPASLRSEAILSLGWIGTRSAIISLAHALTIAPPDLAREILMSIGKTEQERDYASQVTIDYWRSNRFEHPAIVKQEIVAALGNLGNLTTIPDLIELLGDPDDRVKLYTISAISKLSPTMPTEILQLADRSDLPSALQHGVRMCLSYWEIRQDLNLNRENMRIGDR
jgi:HEAT repeat protein